MIRPLTLALTVLLGTGLPVRAEVEPVAEQLTLRLSRLDGTLRIVEALLTRPATQDPAAAVVLVPDTLGMDERLSEIAERLSQQGWATLQVDPDPVSTDGHVPPDAGRLGFSANANPVVGDLAVILHYLSSDHGFDPDRIAVVGLGTGGRAALLSSSEASMTSELGPFGPRFAAHAALYPGCRRLIADGLASPGAWTGAPAGIFLAGRDDQDTATDCATLANDLATVRRPPMLWHVYPMATYAWDMGAVSGGTPYVLPVSGPSRVRVTPDADVAADAIERLVMFLRPVLSKPRTER